MAYKKCDNCKEWHWTDRDCAPIFLITHEDFLGDEEHQIHAYDHEEAACKYAKYYNEDCGEYPMMNGDSEIIIQVRGYLERVKKTISVTAEPSIDYSSEEIKS